MPAQALQHSSSIDAATIAEYRETEFRVLGEREFTLLVDQVSPALVASLRTHRADCAAFVTAANPYSRQCTTAENSLALGRLAHELSKRGLQCDSGVGIHPSGNWPGEESFLVYGLALEAAKVLGAKYQQNAIVWAGADAVPRLVLLR
jgi:hypothetical protein